MNRFKISGTETDCYRIPDSHFSLHGVFYDKDIFRRMPEEVAKNTNNGVVGLHTNTAGGRIRFKTNSSFVCIKAIMSGIYKPNHFTLEGTSGFDIYDDNIYIGSFLPPTDLSEGYESKVNFPEVKEHNVLINMPLYSNVNELFIGLEPDSKISPADEYTFSKPVVFYGSSITQGGCASRPGNSYQQILSRWLDFDYINLGFSGSAKGEDAISDYIAGLDMSIFVYDYDHNAPTVEHLSNTHEKMFKSIRNKHPDLPIIVMTRPKVHLTDEEKQRLDVIRKTYNNAVREGDKNVYLLTGTDLIKDEFIETATVDNCHPNDSGFVSMAISLRPIFEKILNK